MMVLVLHSIVDATFLVPSELIDYEFFSIFIFQAAYLKEDVYLDAINSLLICGEYPPLFSNDELDGLLQVISCASSGGL